MIYYLKFLYHTPRGKTSLVSDKNCFDNVTERESVMGGGGGGGG